MADIENPDLELSKENTTNQQKNVNKHSQVEKISTIPEIGGGKGPEPTRYGQEWEVNGRVSDF